MLLEIQLDNYDPINNGYLGEFIISDGLSGQDSIFSEIFSKVPVS